MTGAFAGELKKRGGVLARAGQALAGLDAQRSWFYVPYDQLHEELPAWAGQPAEKLGFVFVESTVKAGRRPYHKQKLALVLANQRHFALEQAQRGVEVRYLVGDLAYADALQAAWQESGLPLTVAEPAERELREELEPACEAGWLRQVEHGGWLSTVEQFREACPQRPYRMDAFYRRMRRDTGFLMEQGKPVGGKWSLDAENRQPWKGEPPAPERPCFPLDPVKEEVAALIEQQFGEHPGELDLEHLPATRADAEQAWAWALDACMENFGTYEDAISEASSGLFHTRISQLLNLHRLLPQRVVEDAVASSAPLNSREGFLRQVLGWREFVRHVHRETEGFTALVPAQQEELPPVYWGAADSGLRCLDHTVAEVWREGYSHHITRLMILGNLATLLELDTRALSDWFWVAYTDAFDWVVEPIVLGMATWASAGVMTTKPYISGAAYIDRVSDHCAPCRFHPKKDCPITRLYWAWLGRHAAELEGNVRMAMPLRSLAKRSAEKRAEDAEVFTRVRGRLQQGLPV